MSDTYKDKFGYLPYGFEVNFSRGRIIPRPHFDKAVQLMRRRTHTNQYVYPPRKAKSTPRAASLHHLPSTHTLELDGRFPNQEQVRYGDGGFVIHFLGFLYGHRCQFYDWWVDGRVLIPDEIDHRPPSPKQAEEIISHALRTWRDFQNRQRFVAINALFLHTRTQMYEFEWERFSNNYQIFDAVYALARDTGVLSRSRLTRHEDRIGRICDQFEIPMDSERVKRLVKLRNDLLHEAIWDERMPGESRSEFSFQASHWLHRLTKRAMLAVLGLRGPYIKTHWWTFGKFRFDI